MVELVAAVDVGTTGSKAIIMDLEGRVMGSGYQEYTCTYPNPKWVEQSAEDVLNGAFEACRLAVAAASVHPSAIKAISFSAQRATFGLMDESNSIINDCLYVWQDNRAESVMDLIHDRMEAYEFYKIQGQPVTPTFSLEKIVWLQQNEPELLDKAHKLVMVPDLVAYAFGADDVVAEQANAGCSSMLDIQSGDWSMEICHAYGIDRALLPKIVKAGTPIGKVNTEGAWRSGLSEGTIIICGSGDNQCGALGAGICEPGEASMSLGTSGVLVVGSDRPVFSEDMGLMVANALAPGLYELEAIQLGAASSYRWIRDTLCGEEIEKGSACDMDPFDLMEVHVQNAPAGANGVMFLPYLVGAGYPHWNTKASGGFLGIDFSTNRGDMIRSVMEGITLESKDMYETMKKRGVNIDVMTIIGGATKSPSWRQMIADMFNVKVRKLKNPDATLTGAAILAAVGSGLYEDIPEGITRMVKFESVIEPNEVNAKIYEEKYQEFQSIYKGLKEQCLY